MTKSEIGRHLAVGRSRSVCIDISIPDRYPGWVRSIHLQHPALVQVEYEVHGFDEGGIYCQARFQDLDRAIASIESFLSTPLRQWLNCTATGYYPQPAGDHEEGTRAIVVDILAGRLALPKGAEFDIKPAYWTESCGSWQPRVMRHSRHGMSPEFAIHDVYFDANGYVIGYSRYPRSDRAGSLGDLKKLIASQVSNPQAPTVYGDSDTNNTPDRRRRFWLDYVDHEVLEYDEDPAHIKIS